MTCGVVSDYVLHGPLKPGLRLVLRCFPFCFDVLTTNISAMKYPDCDNLKNVGNGLLTHGRLHIIKFGPL